MNLARFPRVKLCTAPTPLEPLPGLTRRLGGPQIWIKRDDLTGMGGGGNKVRKLEYLAGDAIARGADHLVTQGAVQSNHVRQTAAVAARLGLRCTAVLEHRIETNDPAYLRNGNVLLDHLIGCTLEYRPGGTDMQAAIEAKADELRATGATPYVIPGGGSNPAGALGYAHVAFELVAQANEAGLSFDRLVHATGSAGTQAGLVAGLHALSTRSASSASASATPGTSRKPTSSPSPAPRPGTWGSSASSRPPPSRPTAATSAPATATPPRAWSRPCRCSPAPKASSSTPSTPERPWPA